MCSVDELDKLNPAISNPRTNDPRNVKNRVIELDNLNPDISPLGDWEGFNKAVQKELNNIDGWAAWRKGNPLRGGGVNKDFPMLSGATYWYKQFIRTTRPDTELWVHMKKRSSYLRGHVSGVIDLLMGGRDASALDWPGVIPDHRGVFTPLLIWDFTLACINVSTHPILELSENGTKSVKKSGGDSGDALLRNATSNRPTPILDRILGYQKELPVEKPLPQKINSMIAVTSERFLKGISQCLVREIELHKPILESVHGKPLPKNYLEQWAESTLNNYIKCGLGDTPENPHLQDLYDKVSEYEQEL